MCWLRDELSLDELSNTKPGRHKHTHTVNQIYTHTHPLAHSELQAHTNTEIQELLSPLTKWIHAVWALCACVYNLPGPAVEWLITWRKPWLGPSCPCTHVSAYCVSVCGLCVRVSHLFLGGAHAHDLLHNRPLSLSHILEIQRTTQMLELHPVCQMFWHHQPGSAADTEPSLKHDAFVKPWHSCVL